MQKGGIMKDTTEIEQEMAAIIMQWDKRGARFLNEDNEGIKNCEQLIDAFNYVVEKGVQNCTKELQEAFVCRWF
jgi:hypothetical protein